MFRRVEDRGAKRRAVARSVVVALAMFALLALGPASSSSRRALDQPTASLAADTDARRDLAELAAALLTADGARLLAELQIRYRIGFERLRDQTRADAARLIVVYLSTQNGRAHRDWFAELCGEHGVPFYDASSALAEDDGRAPTASDVRDLDRVDCERVANHLAPIVAKFLPDAPLPSALPGTASYGWIGDAHATRHGLRDDRPLTRPKLEHHVLLLGDALTSCPGLDVDTTWGSQLERLLPATRVLDASLPHATVVDHAALFAERARLADIDLVVLQVADDDLAELCATVRRWQARDRTTTNYAPTARERALVERLRRQPASHPPR